MDALLALLTLQRQAQDAATRSEFLHVIVNQTHKLIPYRQAVFWRDRFIGPEIEKISGHAVLDVHGPYAQSLLKKIKALPRGDFSIHTEDTSDGLFTFVPLYTVQDGALGGLVFEHERAYSEAEKNILKEMSLSYAPVLALHELRSSSGVRHRLSAALRRGPGYKRFAVLVLLMVALVPVRSSVTAPVEIVARDADYVTSPFDGLIAHVDVDPSADIAADQIVVRFDNTVLRSDAELARQSFEMAQASLSRLRRESLSSPEKKNELGILEAEIAEKRIRSDYAQAMLERSSIRSPRAGVAIFPSKESLEGHPVRAGDVLMKIADPSDYQALIRIPVSSMIEFSKESAVDFFVNVRPAYRYEAMISYIGYESGADANGEMSYKVVADIRDGDDLRIGWKGTAKIRAGWSLLGLEMLRRPAIFVRRITGW